MSMRIEKPWGEVRQFTFNQNASVKLITLKPDQKTSLHRHHLRDDFWLILDEGIVVQIGDEVIETKPGDEFVVPAEKLHRIISQGKEARVLEIAFGYSFEEDDYMVEDDYGRLTSKK